MLTITVIIVIVELLLLALRHMRFSEAGFVRDSGFVVQNFFEGDKWFHGGMTGPTVPMGNVSPCFTFWQWMKPLKPSMMLKLRIPRIPRIPRTHSDRIWQWIWHDMINKSFEPTSTPQNIQAQFPGYSFNRRSCGGGWQHGGHFESQTDSASNRDCGFTEFVDGSVIAGKLRVPHNRVDNIICMRYKDISRQWQILIVMAVESLTMDTRLKIRWHKSQNHLGPGGVPFLHKKCAVQHESSNGLTHQSLIVNVVGATPTLGLVFSLEFSGQDSIVQFLVDLLAYPLHWPAIFSLLQVHAD